MLSFHCAAVTKVFFLDIKLCSLPRHVVFYKDAPSSLCVHACVCVRVCVAEAGDTKGLGLRTRGSRLCCLTEQPCDLRGRVAVRGLRVPHSSPWHDNL